MLSGNKAGFWGGVESINTQIKLSRNRLERAHQLSDYYFERLLADLKANFNPAQPRDQLGRWVIGGGSSPVFRAGGGPKPDGHHFVPGAVYRNLQFSPEAQRALSAEKTGRLRAEPHRWSEQHSTTIKRLRIMLVVFSVGTASALSK